MFSESNPNLSVSNPPTSCATPWRMISGCDYLCCAQFTINLKTATLPRWKFHTFNSPILPCALYTSDIEVILLFTLMRRKVIKYSEHGQAYLPWPRHLQLFVLLKLSFVARGKCIYASLKAAASTVPMLYNLHHIGSSKQLLILLLCTTVPCFCMMTEAFF